MADPLSQQELEAAHCWEAEDRVPGRPEMTAFRRQLRYHQARWREANGHPIGSQPIVPKPGGAARPVGSRLPLAYAQETGANFVTAGALDAARARTSIDRASPELRSPATVGRPPVVAGAGLQPLRRPGRRPRAGRPGRPHVVAGRARHRVRRPLRALARPLRSRLPQQPSRVRCGVRARPRRRDAGDRRPRHQLPRPNEAGDPEADATSRGISRSPRGQASSRRERPTRSRGGRISP